MTSEVHMLQKLRKYHHTFTKSVMLNRSKTEPKLGILFSKLCGEIPHCTTLVNQVPIVSRYSFLPVCAVCSWLFWCTDCDKDYYKFKPRPWWKNEHNSMPPCLHYGLLFAYKSLQRLWRYNMVIFLRHVFAISSTHIPVRVAWHVRPISVVLLHVAKYCAIHE